MQDDLKSQIQSLAQQLFGSNFSFREYQLDAIEAVIANATSNIKHTMLEAPTGSGKSMIALISAYVLYRLYNKKSYILVSDLSLFKQYEDDIAKLNNNCFGSIKGKEAYVCRMNECKVSQATCSLQGYSPKTLMFKRGMFSCKHQCQYVHDYVQAMHAPITLMTYQLYFIQRNYVEDGLFNGKNANFPERDLVICDECHKICDICQSHFAPRIQISRPYWMDDLDKYMHHFSNEDVRFQIVNKILDCNESNELIDLIADYARYLEQYLMDNETIRNRLADKRKLTKSDKKALFAGNLARQEHCKFDDMLGFIGALGSAEYAVKTLSNDEITLNFIFDDIMLKKYFHDKSKCEMLMSATIGDFAEYAKLAGLDKKSCRAISLPSTFDFTNSPVMFSDKNKMSYDDKAKSMQEIVNQTLKICNENAACRGIIQTGSYANSDALMNSLPDDVLKRCLFYKGTEEKTKMLNEFMNRSANPNDNSILIGPTLVEGLNFPDNICRFQICIKVPYAYLGSEYVRKKMEYVAGWYEYDVLNKLCQGIGRGVRHKSDWCKTYILDGCISHLVSKLNRFSALNGRFKKLELN